MFTSFCLRSARQKDAWYNLIFSWHLIFTLDWTAALNIIKTTGQDIRRLTSRYGCISTSFQSLVVETLRYMPRTNSFPHEAREFLTNLQSVVSPSYFCSMANSFAKVNLPEFDSLITPLLVKEMVNSWDSDPVEYIRSLAWIFLKNEAYPQSSSYALILNDLRKIMPDMLDRIKHHLSSIDLKDDVYINCICLLVVLLRTDVSNTLFWPWSVVVGALIKDHISKSNILLKRMVIIFRLLLEKSCLIGTVDRRSKGDFMKFVNILTSPSIMDELLRIENGAEYLAKFATIYKPRYL